MIRCLIKVFQYLTFLILLVLPTIIWAASGWVKIDLSDKFTTTTDFGFYINYSVTEADTYCQSDIFQVYASSVTLVDGAPRGSYFYGDGQFKGCCGRVPFGTVASSGIFIYINGLSPGLHTLTTYLKDRYYMSNGSCGMGDIIAQDTRTFRICNGIADPCCQPNADLCCWSNNLCCGTSDACCGNSDSCCKNPGPCCNNPCCDNQCCEQGGSGSAPGSGSGNGDNPPAGTAGL